MTTWEQLIQDINSHAQSHIQFQRPVRKSYCERCHPTRISTYLPWDNCLDGLLKPKFGVVGISGYTQEAFKAFNKALEKYSKAQNNQQNKDKITGYARNVITACQYTYTPNYTIEKAIEILIGIGLRTQFYTDVNRIVQAYHEVKDEARQKGETLFDKPKSPVEPTYSINLGEPLVSQLNQPQQSVPEERKTFGTRAVEFFNRPFGALGRKTENTEQTQSETSSVVSFGQPIQTAQFTPVQLFPGNYPSAFKAANTSSFSNPTPVKKGGNLFAKTIEIISDFDKQVTSPTSSIINVDNDEPLIDFGNLSGPPSVKSTPPIT